VPIKPVVVLSTLIFLYVAPNGTITVKLVEVALLAIVLTAPKKTTLFAAVVLNPEPDMVTLVPTGPLAGEKPEMIGCENDEKEIAKKTKIPRHCFISAWSCIEI